MKRRTAFISIAALAALAVSGVGLAGARTTPVISQAQTLSAKQAFEVAMNASQSVTGTRIPASVARLDGSQLATMDSAGSARLRHSFTGKALGPEVKAMKQAERMNATGQFRSAGGSADHFVYRAVNPVDATHLSLAGSYVSRSKVFIPDKAGRLVEADPSGILDFTAEMEKDATTGLWMVASYDWEFAPGSEP